MHMGDYATVSDTRQWVVCKLWPTHDTRLLSDRHPHYSFWIGYCAECNRKVVVGKKQFQLEKAGKIRLICEQCDIRSSISK